MATYVVGDIHGCFRTLECLLSELPFEKGKDRLWLVGDLVNRGPDSLAVLRWAQAAERKLGDRFVAVLGNHDLHLLASLAGYGRPYHQEALEEVLAARDRAEIEEWLAARPLLHREGDLVVVHAGLLPDWTIEDAESEARRVETLLRDKETRRELFRTGRVSEDRGLEALTRLRYLTRAGEVADFTGPPADASPGLTPWFEIEARSSAQRTVVAGHWSTLGLLIQDGLLILDTGCVYGGALTGVRLEDRAVFSVLSLEA